MKEIRLWLLVVDQLPYQQLRLFVRLASKAASPLYQNNKVKYHKFSSALR